jgi:hypothetical protein
MGEKRIEAVGVKISIARLMLAGAFGKVALGTTSVLVK